MLSVISITFNNHDELLSTTTSLSSLEIEHIIVNGGSCPKTAKFLSSFSGKSVSEPDQGISDAFNKGIRLSTGTGIIFLNSGDTLVDPSYLIWAEAQLNQYDFTYSDIYFDDPIAGKIQIRPTHQPLGRGMPFPHQTMVVKKSIFDEVGHFKIEYKRAMCFEFTCRLLAANKKGIYYPKPTVLMEGTGISTKQETHTLLESKKAMVDLSQFDYKNRYYYLIRKIGLIARQFLINLGLKPVLKQIKIWRHS
jgi:glycosyltransferase involved in cell wall biosynthesis